MLTTSSKAYGPVAHPTKGEQLRVQATPTADPKYVPVSNVDLACSHLTYVANF